jgi:radical SAM protein with 4Fe4S-binding SPASM domain
LSKNIQFDRIQIELTSKCNFKCLTCKHGFEDYGEHLDDKVCDVVCYDIIPYSKEIELQGTGESLLSPHFHRVLNTAIQHSCYVILITNASLLNDDLINKFISANMQLIVSLDGANANTFSLHRPIGSFSDIINNLSKIVRYKVNHSCSNFSLVVNMTVTKLNYREIPQMIELLSSLGIDYLFASEVRECMPDRTIWDSFRLDNIKDRAEFDTKIKQYAELAQTHELGFSFNPYLQEKKLKKKICPSPWKHLFVKANGDISVCCELNNYFGNLKTDTIQEIWNNTNLNAFRNEMLLGVYNRHCLNCCLSWGLPYET